MTSPAGDGTSSTTSTSSSKSSSSAPARPAHGDLVSYTFRDPIFGTDLRGAAVVVDVPDAGSVKVAPLSPYLLEVDPAQLTALSAGDVTA